MREPPTVGGIARKTLVATQDVLVGTYACMYARSACGDMADQSTFMKVFGVEDFLRNPPEGFLVETRGSGHTLVKFDPNSCCVFIDEFYLDGRNVMFQFSPGR